MTIGWRPWCEEETPMFGENRCLFCYRWKGFAPETVRLLVGNAAYLRTAGPEESEAS